MWLSARRLAAATLVLSLVAAGAAAPVARQASAESTVMQIELQPDGDARWTVSVRFALADENETAAFDRLAREFVAEEAPVISADPYRAAADLAGEATGRAMAVRTVDRAASQANGTGELRLSFTWTNFTRVSAGGDRLVLGDVFTTPSGTWLPGLRENQVLVIEFPEGFGVESVSRGLDNRSIRVVGPASFEPGEPSATLERTGRVTTRTTPGEGFGTPSALTAGAALAILLVVAYLLYRRRQVDGADEPAEGSGPHPDEPPASGELLSDEERVLRLLRAEGGRMKQIDIVEETDWSNAKVSQLLSAMAEEGRVEKLRIGRENLISLPDEGD